jgi:ketosteroid isomerase-like protein
VQKSFGIVVFIVIFVAVISSSSSRLNAQQPGVHDGANPSAEGEIKALDLKLADLIIRGDWDEYAKVLTSDYLRTRENGQLENKDEALASLRDPKRRIIVMEMEPASFLVRIYGDAAIANAEFTITVRDSGQVKSRRSRLADVFVKRDGQWRLVAEQGTTIGK